MPTVSETPEVDEHYWAQVAIIAALANALRDVWPNLDPSDPLGSVANVRRLIAAIVPDFASAAISTAADYYEDVRALHVPGRHNAPTIDVPEPDEVARKLVDATRQTESRARLIGVDELEAEIAAELERELDGLARSTVADSASNEIFAALGSDRQAVGWARVTRLGACYFCRMLATRGAVYRTEGTANFRAHVPKNGRGGVCRCTVEPLFGKYYEPPAHTRADIAIWEQRVRDEGFTGSDAVNEFRRWVEGRQDGARRDGSGEQAQRRPRASESGFDNLTPDQLRNQLAVLEGLPDSDYRTAQLERVRKRLAELGN